MFRISLAAVTLIAMTLTARADDKYVTIALADGRVLAVADDSDDAGPTVVVVKAGDSKAQQWKVVEDGKLLKVVNRKSGKVLDVSENSTEEGGKIIIWEEKADDNDNQRWSWVGDGKAKQLKSKSSSLVLEADEKGAVVQKKADDKAKGQLWTVTEVK
ncbi:RICIN domain-containing protein [Limnoglobus roseus]|uniref:CBM13 containing protein n=1 Tax=Limnoglobus roseus TaxID=2598579 RepID=A0A5C1AS03_9BACT|nr:RICIN domain-containing protein [Limnoglobus roseus]QEL19668.1 CBM13 containing protein [Limnoglobus roseus]